MDADVFDEPLTLHVDEEPVRARDVAWLREVRPAFSSEYYATLDVEPLQGEYVRVLWRCDPVCPPMGPATIFRGHEWLAVRQ